MTNEVEHFLRCFSAIRSSSGENSLFNSVPHFLIELIGFLWCNFLSSLYTELNKDFSPEEIRVAEKHLKTCLTSLVIRETQFKTTLRFHLTTVRMAKIKTQAAADAGEDVEK